MVSIIISTQSYAYVPKTHKPISDLTHLIAPSLNLTRHPLKNLQKYKKASRRHFRFIEVDKACDLDRIDGSWCCSCRNSEEDTELEAEILEFMSKSEKPAMFPTRDELLRSGRSDLVEAIKKRGGWYSLGWDDEDDDVINGTLEFDVGEFNKRVQNSKEGAILRKQRDDLLDKRGGGDGFTCEVNGTAGNLDSLESDPDEETGIEGILSRLEKQRNSDFGINLEKGGHETRTTKDGGYFESYSGIARPDPNEISRLTPRFDHKGTLNSSNGKFGPNFEPINWRNWSNQRAGFQATEFEAEEIYFPKSGAEHERETYIDETVEENIGSLDRGEDINHSQVRARLQHLELELNSTLHSLKSLRDDRTSSEVSLYRSLKCKRMLNLHVSLI